MIAVRIAALAVALLLPSVLAYSWASSAGDRLVELERQVATAKSATEAVPIASAANAGYCTPQLRQVLRRVLQSCGLLSSGSVRGCQPADARTVATMEGADFNALFRPMKHRGGIIQFEQGESVLDPTATELINQVFADQKGASYFFVVSRASPEGTVERNRELSKQRAEAVMSHLRGQFSDPDLDKEVGLLWLGEEFAQLSEEFCAWRRSRTGECQNQDLNRSAFVAWIDCTL
jgi:outer membrane protein OmpA-like peptidoglycan-associated protein